MKKVFVVFATLIMLFILGCAEEETPQTAEQKPAAKPVVTVSKEPITGAVVQEVVGITEPEKEEVKEPEEDTGAKKEASEDVEELLSKAEQKVQSISYRYKGPETADFFYKFYVKGDRVRYIARPAVKVIDVDEDAYESVFIKKDTEFAGGYCVDKKCTVSGKKATLNYDESYIKTPFDWLDQAGDAEKLGEELIGKRQTWRLKTDNAGFVWVDTYYGVPLQVEFNGSKHQFTQMTFNDVKDSDVIPG